MIRDLVRQSAIYTIASLLTRVMIFVWLLVLPSYLDNEQYGFLGLLSTFATLFSVLVTLEISQGLARFTPAEEKAALPSLVSTGWQFALGCSVIASVLLLLVSPLLAMSGLGNKRYLFTLQLGIAWLCVNSLFLILQNQLRWEFRARQFLVASGIFAFASIGLSVGFAANFADPLAGAILGQLLAAGIAFVYCLFVLWPHLWSRFDRARLRRLLAFSAPLVPASLSLFACAYANRLILADTLGLEKLGLFTWANQLSSIPGILIIGIQAAITPLTIRHHAEPETPVRLARAFEVVFSSGVIFCFCLAVTSPILINVLSYEQFAAAPVLIALSAPGLLFLQLYVFFPGFAIAKRTDFQLLASVIGGVSVLAIYPLVAAFDVVGAALSALLSGIAFLTAWILLSSRFYPVPVRWGRLGLLSVAAGSATSVPLLTTLPSDYPTACVLGFVFIIVVIFGLDLVRFRDLSVLSTGLRD